MNDSKTVRTIQNHKQNSVKLLLVFILSDYRYPRERPKRRWEQGWLALDHCLNFQSTVELTFLKTISKYHF